MPGESRSRRRADRKRTRVVNRRTVPTQQDDRSAAGTSPRTLRPLVRQEKEPDYRYVYRDLKHQAIIGGGILLVFFILRVFFWK